MKTRAKRFYRASRLVTVNAPPPGKEFDPYRDCTYATLDTPDFDRATAFASTDYHECGRVEDIKQRSPFSSEIVQAWEVYPDQTLRSIEP